MAALIPVLILLVLFALAVTVWLVAQVGLWVMNLCAALVKRRPARVKRTKPPKPPEPDAVGYWKKWDGTRKWAVAQDKNDWDRMFKATEEQAPEPPRVARPVPPPVRPKPQPQPKPAEPRPEPAEVFARLRSRLDHLDG
jgi:hypothetical protein